MSSHRDPRKGKSPASHHPPGRGGGHAKFRMQGPHFRRPAGRHRSFFFRVASSQEASVCVRWFLANQQYFLPQYIRVFQVNGASFAPDHTASKFNMDNAVVHWARGDAIAHGGTMTYVAKWCLHADKREDTGPDDACYLLTLVPAALTPVARLGSMSSMTEHAANTELPGLIAPAAAHWVEQRMDWLALLPTLPPWRAAPPAQTDPTSDFQLLGGMLMEIQKQMAAQTAVVALLRDEMAERRRETSHLNNDVTALQAGAPLISQCPFVCDTAAHLAEHFRRARSADHKRVASGPAEGGDPRIAGLAAYLPTVGLRPCPRRCGKVYVAASGNAQIMPGPVPPAHPLPPAPDLLPFMPTSTDGIARRQAAEAAQTQVGAPLQWALDNPDFFFPYVRDTAVRTSPRIPTSARDAIGAAIRPIWDISHSARGAMREAACHLAILFPAAVLWSHSAGANAHVVRTAIDHRLALWRQGDIPALLHEAALARETIQPTASGPATSRGYLRGRISWRVGKAVRLIRVGRFRDAAALAENHGVAEPSAENIDELRRLFPPPAADDPSGLLPPPEPDDIPPITVCPDDLHGVLQRAPADSACHRDGWRVTTYLLSSSTLIPLWKKDEEARGDLRGQAEAQNSPYRPPIRPIGFSSALTRVASSAAMWTIRDHIARAVGPSQFALSTPAGTDMIQWVIHVAMEMDDRLAASSIDASNAYGMTNRRAIRRRLVADPALHSLLPLFDMLYAGPSENWLYDHESDGDAPTVVLTQLRGIRQGCPLATFFFCLTVGPVFDAITAKLGMGGLGLAFADDLHLLGTALGTALALHSAQPALAAVGLSISGGPDKTEVAFAPAEHGAGIREWEGLLPRAAGAPSPPPCPPSGPLDAAAFSRARDPAVLPHLVTGFRRCLGVPRHRKLDPTFVRDALRRPAARQDAILLMAREIADAGHIHASLRLVQVHARIATTMVSILQEAGAPRDSVLTEVRGLRSADATRPGDVVRLDYMGPGVHLVLDAAVTCVFRNSIAAQVAVQPGYAARLREQTKFRVDACSSQPVARRHRFVPCVVEEAGRLGEHLLALLKELAERGFASGHLKQPPSWRELRPAALVAHWIRKWTVKLFVALHIVLAEYLCRHTGSRPFGFGGRSFRPAGRHLPATSPGPAARR
eukprot:jgi/Tetstr1/458197/TSEL_044687.t2